MTNSDLSTAIDLKHELDRIAMIASCIRFVTLARRRAAARVDASPRVVRTGGDRPASRGALRRGHLPELEGVGFRPAPFVLITGLRLYRTVYRSENTLVSP